MALKLELALHGPAGEHPLVRCQGPHLGEVGLGQVIIDREFLAQGGISSFPPYSYSPPLPSVIRPTALFFRFVEK